MPNVPNENSDKWQVASDERSLDTDQGPDKKQGQNVPIPTERRSVNKHPSPATRHSPLEIQERFDGSSDRTWYTFNGLRFIQSKNSATLIGAGEWPGFGVDTENGKNGTPFRIGGNNCIEFDIAGTAPEQAHIELTDAHGAIETISFTLSKNHPHQKLLLKKVRDKITKLQFIFNSGDVNCTLKNIGFSRAKKTLSNMFIPNITFDRGTSHVKMALVDNHQNPLLLDIEELPATVSPDESTAQAIRTLLSRHKLKVQQFNIVLTNQATAYRRIPVKATDKKNELLSAIKKELLPLVPFPADTAAIGYTLNTKEQAELFVAAMPPTVINTYREIGKRTGVTLSAIVDVSMALQELYVRLYPDAPEVTAVIDIGHRTTTVIIVKDRSIVFARQIRASVQETPERWGAELVRLLEYHSNDMPLCPVERIMLCGGGSLLPNIASQIEGLTSVPTMPLFSQDTDTGFQQILLDHGPRLALFAGVLGLAMMRSSEQQTADLQKSLPKPQPHGAERIKERLATDRTTRQWFTYITAAIIIMILFALFIWGRTYQLRRTISVQRARYAQLEPLAVSANELVQKLREADSMLEHLEQDKKVVGFFIPISKPLPGISVTLVRYQPALEKEDHPSAPKVYIEGTAENKLMLAQYLQHLHKQPLLKNIIEESIIPAQGSRIVFRYTLLLHGGL